MRPRLLGLLGRLLPAVRLQRLSLRPTNLLLKRVSAAAVAGHWLVDRRVDCYWLQIDHHCKKTRLVLIKYFVDIK